MPCKDKETARASRRKWYKNNKEHARKEIVRRKREIRSWFVEYRNRLCCERCGFSVGCALEFHHTDPSTKELEVTLMVAHGWGIKRIKEEMAKCEVICANCRKIEHFG